MGNQGFSQRGTRALLSVSIVHESSQAVSLLSLSKHHTYTRESQRTPAQKANLARDTKRSDLEVNIGIRAQEN